MSENLIIPAGYSQDLFGGYTDISSFSIAASSRDVRPFVISTTVPCGVLVMGSFSSLSVPLHAILSITNRNELNDAADFPPNPAQSYYFYNDRYQTTLFCFPTVLYTNNGSIEVDNLIPTSITIGTVRLITFENPTAVWNIGTRNADPPLRAWAWLTTQSYRGDSGNTYGTPFKNRAFTRGRAFLQVTAASGTSPTLDVNVVGKYPQTDSYHNIGTFPTQSTTGAAMIKLDTPLPSLISVEWTIGGTTPSFSFNVWLELER
jgi:hypothetical protein